MNKKALFLAAITLIFSGCAIVQQKKANQVRPLERQEKKRHSTTPVEPNPFNVLMVLVACLFALSIGTALGRSRDERQLALPVSLIEPFFMPHEWRECTRRLHQDLQNARKKICIASYWLTHLSIITALRIARKKNISVEVIFDKSTPNASTLRQQFKSIDIKFTESDVDAARMHHKFIVIDDTITWVGSANLTGTAFRKNYENMMRIQSPEIAQRYLLDFKNLMQELGQSEVFKQKTQQATWPAYARYATRKPIFHIRSNKPISDYQKRVLSDFGIDWQKLNYDEAYAVIDRVINSARRLLEKRSVRR